MYTDKCYCGADKSVFIDTCLKCQVREAINQTQLWIDNPFIGVVEVEEFGGQLVYGPYHVWYKFEPEILTSWEDWIEWAVEEYENATLAYVLYK